MPSATRQTVHVARGPELGRRGGTDRRDAAARTRRWCSSVDDLDTSATFLATHVANIARATVPADRVGDVLRVRRPRARLLRGTADREGRARNTTPCRADHARRSAPRAAGAVRGARVRPRSRRLRRPPPVTPGPTGCGATCPAPRPLPALPGELAASSPLADRGLDRVAVLALLWLVGAGGRRGRSATGSRRQRPRRPSASPRSRSPRSRWSGSGCPSPGRGARRSPQRWPASAGMRSDSSRGRRARIRRRRSTSDQMHHHEHHRRHDPVPEP